MKYVAKYWIDIFNGQVLNDLVVNVGLYVSRAIKSLNFLKQYSSGQETVDFESDSMYVELTTLAPFEFCYNRVRLLSADLDEATHWMLLYLLKLANTSKIKLVVVRFLAFFVVNKRIR